MAIDPTQNTIYNIGMRGLLDSADGTFGIAWETDTIRVLLVKSGHISNRDDNDLSGMTLDELANGSYSRKTLANAEVAADDGNNRGTLDADNVTWTALSGGETIVGVMIIKDTGDASTSRPICLFVLASSKTTDGTDLVLTWNSGGILVMSGIGD